MKVKVDENMPVPAAAYLRSAGYLADTVADEGLRGADDDTVCRAAAAEQRVLLTYDVDFADIRHYPPGVHSGIVVFRLSDQRWKGLEEPLRRLVSSGVQTRLGGGLAIVTDSNIRMHSGAARTQQE